MPKDHVRIELATPASLRQGGGAGAFFDLEWSTMPRDVAQGLKRSVLLLPKLLKRRKIDRCSHVATSAQRTIASGPSHFLGTTNIESSGSALRRAAQWGALFLKSS
jgi:hypothetical protein